MKITIRTRLLIYFLFLTILPLFILASTSAIILNSSIDSRLVNDLNDKSNSQWREYNKTITEVRDDINNLICQVAFLVSLAGILLGYIFSRSITKPISAVSDAVKSIKEGDYTKRVEIQTNDELEYLAKSYNSMAVTLEKRYELETQRDDFIATLTHDLKVPLFASVQTLDYLLKGSYGDLSEKQKYIIEHLKVNSTSLLNMVNTILDSYKYEAGKQNLTKRKFNLNKLIGECISDIAPLIQEKNHEINSNISAYDVEIKADRHEIKRVIINLLSNSIVYTPLKGKIDINVDKTDNFTVVRISDNGIGIMEDSLKAIFDRYSKGSRTLRKIGTGLGLYLSKHIVEAHGGQIWVESKENKGSIFYFSIPSHIESEIEENG
ncbi:MAG: HAMP domain-containing sensor histidine kinase [Candidatus Gastranaerophilales bacterium]|nr:HAMP domain-containing sensor histidine kinase [Candidatus Gastranaerophilales bacterium]